MNWVTFMLWLSLICNCIGDFGTQATVRDLKAKIAVLEAKP